MTEPTNLDTLVIKIDFHDKYTYRVVNIADLDARLKLSTPFDDHVLACTDDIMWYLQNILHMNPLEVHNMDEILRDVNLAIEKYQAVTYGIYFNNN